MLFNCFVWVLRKRLKKFFVMCLSKVLMWFWCNFMGRCVGVIWVSNCRLWKVGLRNIWMILVCCWFWGVCVWLISFGVRFGNIWRLVWVFSVVLRFVLSWDVCWCSLVRLSVVISCFRRVWFCLIGVFWGCLWWWWGFEYGECYLVFFVWFYW